MVAYNRAWLNNLAIEHEAQEAFDNNLISSEELKLVKDKYTAGFYTPNPFIRVGLFILTVIIAGLALGLLALMLVSGSNEDTFAGLLIFYAVICYIVLEVMVQTKFHYSSGVDDALICMSVIFLVSGINLLVNISYAANAVIILLTTTYLALRFADMLMSAAAFLSLLGTAFLFYERTGPMAKASMPFVIMVMCLAVYFAMRYLLKNITGRYYFNSITIVEFLALICLYSAGNYFVVREAGSMMYGVELPEGAGIPMGWFFWMLTLLIPVAYIIAGINRKNTVLLRAGLLLVAFIVFTVRYYHSVFPLEVPMSVGGLLMILVSWLLIRYLKQPKHGFTYKEAASRHALDKLNVEALVITETMGGSTAHTPAGNTQFGGGTGGGGGATGSY